MAGQASLQPLGPDGEGPLSWAVSEVQGSTEEPFRRSGLWKRQCKQLFSLPAHQKAHVLPALWASSYNFFWEKQGVGEIVKKEVWDSGSGEGEGAGRLG